MPATLSGRRRLRSRFLLPRRKGSEKVQLADALGIGLLYKKTDQQRPPGFVYSPLGISGLSCRLLLKPKALFPRSRLLQLAQDCSKLQCNWIPTAYPLKLVLQCDPMLV